MLNQPGNPEESIEELMASIRQLVYPSAYPEEILDSISSNASETLSPRSFEESAKALSSFVKAIESQEEKAKSPKEPKSIEAFLGEMLLHPLREFIDNHEPLVSALIQEHITALLPRLLHQWLDTHLASLVTQCVEKHLEAIKEASKASS